MGAVECQYEGVASGTMVVVMDPEDKVFKYGVAMSIEYGPEGATSFEVAVRENGARKFLDVDPASFYGGFETVHAAEAHAAYLNRTD